MIIFTSRQMFVWYYVACYFLSIGISVLFPLLASLSWAMLFPSLIVNLFLQLVPFRFNFAIFVTAMLVPSLVNLVCQTLPYEFLRLWLNVRMQGFISPRAEYCVPLKLSWSDYLKMTLLSLSYCFPALHCRLPWQVQLELLASSMLFTLLWGLCSSWTDAQCDLRSSIQPHYSADYYDWALGFSFTKCSINFLCFPCLVLNLYSSVMLGQLQLPMLFVKTDVIWLY